MFRMSEEAFLHLLPARSRGRHDGSFRCPNRNSYIGATVDANRFGPPLCQYRESPYQCIVRTYPPAFQLYKATQNGCIAAL